ncbi:UDP-3-O-(3-hydroxymyristoyl) glucosamine N-acyltransferase [Luminiphilus syltensis NOR5-1B]|uniref:UDP-3-O-acylglucosamine N-acyltransferase n=1 Tax=Luminiphilus syltensis NOR5-1B TaxID=565045 RepID=B8KY91_9GAMM|nr:UDP-3-O-(3-hydroxymyristoyl)glucosamine N-acyltransferase [Luminiphilus syltensis]EED35919.1 UDP-3-O-(3-hydroxymyristoyl) glucosamine N-acyltransferase [Luminiphilus syltensis NOR5-1B]
MTALRDIAARLELDFRGDADREIDGLAPLDRAGPRHISFVAQKKFLDQLNTTEAGVVIIHPDWLDAWSGDAVLSDNPYLSFSRASWLFDNRPVPSGDIDPGATVSSSATLGRNVTIDAGSVIDADVQLGDDVWIGANCVVGPGVTLGAGTQLRPGVVLHHHVTIGECCLVQSNAVIGSDGFGFAPSPDGWQKILQLASVRIGDRVEIGACTAIDRGALHDTEIADGVIIDNQVHIAHGVRIGRNTAIAACVGIAGSTVIGENCTLAGQVGVGDHVELVDNVHIGGQGRVTRSVTEPGHYGSGTSLQPLKQWSRSALRLEQLDALAKRVAELEKLVPLQEPPCKKSKE